MPWLGNWDSAIDIAHRMLPRKTMAKIGGPVLSMPFVQAKKITRGFSFITEKIFLKKNDIVKVVLPGLHERG